MYITRPWMICCLLRPSFNKSQNFDGLLASPGKRHASPITAMGMSLAICAQGCLTMRHVQCATDDREPNIMSLHRAGVSNAFSSSDIYVTASGPFSRGSRAAIGQTAQVGIVRISGGYWVLGDILCLSVSKAILSENRLRFPEKRAPNHAR